MRIVMCSEVVAMPDMSEGDHHESVPNEAEAEAPNLHPNSHEPEADRHEMTQGQVRIVPMSMSLIESDQLKRVICVDRGAISGATKDKATGWTPKTSWTETACMEVLPVRCKNTSAELHKRRFGSGGRGRCIKYGQDWLTPSEFEALCGRASSKDWKRSIRFGGRSLQALIDEGLLAPHATSCTCAACCDDHTAMGPVRLFTPYKRKRKNAHTDDTKKSKQRHTDNDLQQASDNSNSRDPWQPFQAGDLAGEAIGHTQGDSDYQLLETHHQVTTAYLHPVGTRVQPLTLQGGSEQTPPSQWTNDSDVEVNAVLKRLNEVSEGLVRLSGDLKRCVDDVHLLLRRRTQTDNESNLELETVSLRDVRDADTKKCANCDREASAECSLCRRTPYCSTQCQKRDWTTHQHECLRQHQQQQSIMLIVESPHQ